MRRTKIVCTIGPATRSREAIAELIKAGMNVARLNFSHGCLEEHGQVIDLVRQVSEQLGSRVAILQDLQGPKIRIGALESGSIRLHEGEPFSIVVEPVLGTSERVSTTYRELSKDVHSGDRLLLSDGLVELRVEDVLPTEVKCRVVRGGLVSERSGLNLPGISVSAPSLTEKDVRDLRYGVEREVDFVAVSFVRRPEDVLAAKRLIRDAGADIPVVAKLEKPEAIANLDQILEVADGVMVARGDLGIEVSVESVPILQKMIIARANQRGVPVITATQMLESMVHNPSPTRAEASDVANAILDGTDAVMLSAETAIGQYPLEVVATMSRIAEEAEAAPDAYRIVERPLAPRGSFPHAIAESADIAARRLPAAAIVAFTRSGSTALLVSKYRVPVPIIAVTTSEHVARRMALYWGVVAQVVPRPGGIDEMLNTVMAGARRSGLVRTGDTVVVTASTALAPLTGTTNLLELHRL